jgi:ZIP family zinc transporter
MLSKKKLQFNRYILSLGLAILAGALAAQFLTIPDEYLGLIIAFVAGWFLYLGASDLLPEAHHDDANLLPLLTTLIGIGFMLVVTTFLHA